MTKIYFTTDSISWNTATIKLDPDTSNSISWISSALNSSSVTQAVYANGISAIICNNGLILANTAKEDDYVFASLYKKNIGSQWTTVVSNIDSRIDTVSYGNGVWVAGGDYGRVIFSTNGTSWTSQTQTSNFGGKAVLSIAYGNGLWVAGGTGPPNSNLLAKSTNGISWVTQSSNFSNGNINTVAYGSGLWIIAGYRAQMRISTDTTTWTTVTSNFSENFQGTIYSVSYGNGLWVAGAGASQIRTSTNGSSWTTVANSNFSSNSIIFSISYGNSRWVAAGTYGEMRISTNGSTWTTVNSNFGTTWIYSVSYGNSLWIATGNSGQVRISTDTTTWTTVNSNFGNSRVTAVNYGNSLWIIGNPSGNVYISQNEMNVPPNTKIFSNNDNSFLTIYQNNQQNIYYSNDLENYSAIPLSWTTMTSQLNSIVNKNNVSDLILANSGLIYKYNSSTTNWNQINTGISDNFITGAISTDGIYNIVGENAIYNSTDLISWSVRSFPSASAVNDIISK